MLAMLGALISMPMTSTYAFAMARWERRRQPQHQWDGMPCHKPGQALSRLPAESLPGYRHLSGQVLPTTIATGRRSEFARRRRERARGA